MKTKIDFVNTQLHAGESALAKTSEYTRKMGGKLWHTDTKGKYWSGHHHSRTPKELMDEYLTTIRDLLKNHPELA